MIKSVALNLEVLLTVIVKLTNELFPTTVTLAVLLIFNKTGPTVTLVLFKTTVSFSLQLAVTTLVIFPTLSVLTTAVIQTDTLLPDVILETVKETPLSSVTP